MRQKLDAWREEIRKQRAVRMLGYMGQGIELPCDDLEALIELAEAADSVITRVMLDGGLGNDEAEEFGLDELEAALGKLGDRQIA